MAWKINCKVPEYDLFNDGVCEEDYKSTKSLMTNVGGYRAAEAFQYFRRYPKPIAIASGKLLPAEVLVIGAGVAGLSCFI